MWRPRQIVYGAAALWMAFCIVWLLMMLMQRVSGAWFSSKHIPVMYSMEYFALCFVGGVIAGISHVLLTPVDLIKCRVQVGESPSFMACAWRMYHVESRGEWKRALALFYRGCLPTVLGYGSQSGLKFLFYEIFKFLILVQPRQANAAVPPQRGSATFEVTGLLIASFCAEIIADVSLAPWEAVKIQMQTNVASSNHVLSSSKVKVHMQYIWSKDGMRGFYKGLPPLWARQIPSTMVKLTSFEKIVGLLEWIFFGAATHVSSSAQDLGISLLAGVLAGIITAIVSHPADTVLSKINQRASGLGEVVAIMQETPAKQAMSVESGNDVPSSPIDAGVHLRSLSGRTSPPATPSVAPDVCSDKAYPTDDDILHLLKTISWRDLWRGLGARIVMIAALTALQWICYDSFKVFVGLPTTASVKAK